MRSVTLIVVFLMSFSADSTQWNHLIQHQNTHSGKSHLNRNVTTAGSTGKTSTTRTHAFTLHTYVNKNSFSSFYKLPTQTFPCTTPGHWHVNKHTHTQAYPDGGGRDALGQRIQMRNTWGFRCVTAFTCSCSLRTSGPTHPTGQYAGEQEEKRPKDNNNVKVWDQKRCILCKLCLMQVYRGISTIVSCMGMWVEVPSVERMMQACSINGAVRWLILEQTSTKQQSLHCNGSRHFHFCLTIIKLRIIVI